jgi:hypothetical protein
LEQRWEETLRAERLVRDDYDRFLREQPPQLSSEERALIAALSSDLSALWNAPGTSHQDRKEITRNLVDKVVVHVEHNSEYVGVTIHWQGGFTSQHEVARPVKSYEQLRDCAGDAGPASITPPRGCSMPPRRTPNSWPVGAWRSAWRPSASRRRTGMPSA